MGWIKISARLTSNLNSTTSWNRGLLLETAVLPAPPIGAIAAPPAPAAPPPTPPSIVFTNLALVYATQPVTLTFLVADNLTVTSAKCAVDAGTLVNCNTFSSYTLPTLAAGYHTVTVQITDSGAFTATQTSLQFWVGAATQNCVFNGASVASGASVTAYLASTVSFGDTCLSQSRTCSNGTLSGTYLAASCLVQPQITSGSPGAIGYWAYPASGAVSTMTSAGLCTSLIGLTCKPLNLSEACMSGATKKLIICQ